MQKSFILLSFFCVASLLLGASAAPAFGQHVVPPEPTKGPSRRSRLKVLVVTSARLTPCASPTGSYLNTLSLFNKQNFAQLHGYGFHWNMVQLDPKLKGPWNKIAILRHLTRIYTSAAMEWILWVDNDTLFGLMDRIIPFMRYANKDLVVWSNHPEEITEKWNAWGLNTGVLLIRNTAWSRKLLDDWATLGIDWPSEDPTAVPQVVNTTLQQDMAAEVLNHNAQLYDQSALVYLFKKNPDLLERVFFEHKWKYGFHVHYLSDMPIAQVGNWTMPLIIHYAGAQFCSYGNVDSAETRMESIFHYLTLFGVSLNQTCTLLGEEWEGYSPVNAYQQLQAMDTTLPPLPNTLVTLPNGLVTWSGQGSGEGVI